MRAIIIPGVAAMILAAALCNALAGEASSRAAGKFVVHEWGVQVRSLAAVKTGVGRLAAKEGTTRPVLGPPVELIDDLPSFVVRHGKNYSPQQRVREWEKPVIHFYGPNGLNVEVEVRTPLGGPISYWPKPALVEQTFWYMSSGIQTAVGMKWSGKLIDKPDPRSAPAKISDKHWWHTVRQVPGSYIQTEGGVERFIFYEATAVQEPAVTGKITADELRLHNAHSAASGPIIVISNDMAARHFVRIDGIPAGGDTTIRKDGLLKADGDEKELLAACAEQWKSFGMTEAESAAIVETWSRDILDRPGLIVISRMPQELYERMFPLKITPKPDELVRVGMVLDTLAGQPDRIAWLPSLNAGMEKWGQELSSRDYETRHKAAVRLARTEDLAKALLEKLRKSDDAETRARAAELLGQLEPVVLELPQGIDNRPGARP